MSTKYSIPGFLSVWICLAALPAAAQPVSLELVSGVAFQPGDPVDDDMTHRFLSQDGRFLGVHTRATTVAPGIADFNAEQDAYLFDLQSGARRLISSRWDDPQRASEGITYFGAASQDGRYVALLSESADILPPPAVITSRQLVLFDLQTGDRDLITAKAADPAAGSAGVVDDVGVSDDGRYVVFTSDAQDLLAGITIAPASKNIFLHDRSTGQTQLVTFKAGSATLSANGTAFLVDISSDGRYVTYNSTSSDQTATTDANGSNDLFQWDRDTGTTTLITREVGGNAAGGNGSAATPSGRHVVLQSGSTQLVPGFVDGAGTADSYLWDRNSNTVILLSGALGSATVGANGGTVTRGISDDSRLVILISTATDLIPGFVDNNGADNYDAFLVNRQTGARTLVSRKAGTTNQGANGAIGTDFMPQSADGRYVFYWTQATDIDTAVVDTNGRGDLYRFDHTTGDQVLASRVGSSPTQAGAGQFFGRLPLASSDGSLVVFDLRAPDAVSSRQQLGLFDATTQTATLASSTPLTGTAAAGRSIHPLLLSRAGRYAAWPSFAQAWLYDARTASSSRLSFPAGQPSLPAEGESHAVAMSDDARYLLLSTTGSNLVAGASDQNSEADLVLLDRATQTTSWVSHVAGNPLQTLAGVSSAEAMSADGRFTLFVSDADAVVAGVTGETAGRPHLYVYDRQTDVSQLIDRSSSNAAQVVNGISGGGIFGSGVRHVLFQSSGTDLVPGFIDNNGVFSDLYWYDRDTAEMILVSKRPGASEAGSSQSAEAVKLSNDGRWLIYNNRAMDLIPGGSGGGTHIKGFVFDRATRTHALVASAPGSPNVACTATPPAGSITNTEVVDLSGDGRFVLFESYCKLVAGDTNEQLDTYVLDRNDQSYQLISHVPGNPGQSKGVRAQAARISGDGRFVLYAIPAGPAYRYDRSTQQEVLLSFAQLDGGQPVEGANLAPSEDFSKILLSSTASGIVPYDSSRSDAFLATIVDVFADGFESGDTSAWSAAVP